MATAGKARPIRDEWVSLNEAARALNETRQTILTRVVKGELEAQHIAGRTLIRRGSLDKLVSSRR